MAAISRTPALSVVIKIFGPNNPFWIQTTKGLSMFPLPKLKRTSAPRKTWLCTPLVWQMVLACNPHKQGLGLGESWCRQSLSGTSGIVLGPGSFHSWVREHTGTLEWVTFHQKKKWTRWSLGARPRDAAAGGGGWWWFLHGACLRWLKMSGATRESYVSAYALSNHLSLVNVCFWGLRRGSCFVLARFGLHRKPCFLRVFFVLV